MPELGKKGGDDTKVLGPTIVGFMKFASGTANAIAPNKPNT